MAGEGYIGTIPGGGKTNKWDKFFEAMSAVGKGYMESALKKKMLEQAFKAKMGMAAVQAKAVQDRMAANIEQRKQAQMDINASKPNQPMVFKDISEVPPMYMDPAGGFKSDYVPSPIAGGGFVLKTRGMQQGSDWGIFGDEDTTAGPGQTPQVPIDPALRERAIKDIQSLGYPITEKNIQAAVQQYQQGKKMTW